MDILANHQQILDQIEQSKQKYTAQQDVLLLAVSKTKPSEMVRCLYDNQQRHFGENYLQEALQKQQELADCTDIIWHYIGSIQRNKTKDIAKSFAWVHTVERELIAQRLNDQRADNQDKLNVCIQINIDHEESKSGCLPEQTLELAKSIMAMPKLELRGLMIIPSKSSTDAFIRTQQLFTTIKSQLNPPQWDTLSMGMSNDYDDAIKNGSTMIRVGSALFGARNYNN